MKKSRVASAAFAVLAPFGLVSASEAPAAPRIESYITTINPDTLRAEREAVATRYAGCKITGITVTPGIPDEIRTQHTRDHEPRDTVVVKLHITQDPQSIPVVERYWNDGAVSWMPTRIQSHTLKTDAEGKTRPYLNVVGGRGIRDTPTTPSFDTEATFYPRSNYPTGTMLSVEVGTSVTTLGTDDIPRTDVGTRQCGGLIAHVQDGQLSWVSTEVTPLPPFELKH